MKAKHADTTFFKAIFLILMLLGYVEAMAEWRVRIFDRLGTGQVSETATITIGGVAQTVKQFQVLTLCLTAQMGSRLIHYKREQASITGRENLSLSAVKEVAP